MEQKDTPEKGKTHKLARRKFLANLLFCGAAVSVAKFQAESTLIAQRDPKKDWDLPELDEKGKKPESKDGWDLPNDLLDPPPKPQPRPHPRPHPPLPGKPRPPHIRGRVAPPTAGVPVPRPKPKK